MSETTIKYDDAAFGEGRSPYKLPSGTPCEGVVAIRFEKADGALWLAPFDAEAMARLNRYVTKHHKCYPDQPPDIEWELKDGVFHLLGPSDYGAMIYLLWQFLSGVSLALLRPIYSARAEGLTDYSEKVELAKSLRLEMFESLDRIVFVHSGDPN